MLGNHENLRDDEITVEPLPLCIPPGTYDAVVLKTLKSHVFQTRWAVIFTFQIVEQGKYFNVELPGYANLGADRKSARARPCSKLASWCRLVADNIGHRPNRISLKMFREFLFRVEVSTVRHDSRQKERPDRDQYSIVTNIKDIVGKIKQDE